jgi:hypothetical protein
MNKNYPLKAGFLAMLFVLVAQLAFAQQSRVKDDPNGRRAYETRMLIDPKTGKVPENIRESELNFVLTSKSLNQPRSNQKLNVAWTNRGPYNVGGRTRALALDATNESIILAGGVSGGMWRSTNGGTSWTKTTGSSDLHSVTCIAQDTRAGFTNVWYYATGEGYGNSASGGGAAYRGNGVYKSIDGGLTWVQLPSTGANPTVFSGGFQYNWNIIVNPTNGDVYVATAGGIFRSQNGGTNWTNVLDGGVSSVKYTDIAITTTGVLYATINSAGTPNKGIFRSTDGVTWTSIYTGLPTTYDRICIGIAPSNQNVVYFFAHTPTTTNPEAHSFYKYTYVSGNGSGAGGTWVNRSANLPAYGGSVGNLSQGSYNQYVKVKPDNENFVVIGSTNVYRSTDAFASTANNRWIGGYSPANNVSRYPNHHPDNHSFIFLPSNPLTAFSGHDGGISKTTDISRNLTGNEPVAWTQLNNGYLTTQAYSVAIDPSTSGDNRIMAGFQDNGKWYSSTNNGTAAWGEEVAGGDGCFTAIVAGQNIRYHSTQNGKIMKSSGPDPQNPTDNDQIHPSSATGQLFVNPYLLDPNNQNIMYYAGGTRVWRNGNLAGVNSGYGFTGTTTNWTNMTGTAVTTGTVSALAVSTSPANVLYYGTTDGQLYRTDNANSGTGTRVDIYTGKGFPAGAYVSAIAVDPSNSANVMVCFSNYAVKSIFYSTNSGSTWTDISGNLEQNADGSGNGPSVRWVTVHRPASGGVVYLAGTSTGLYATEALSGTTTNWSQEGANSIGNVVVSMIATRSSDALVAIATHANGLYSATLTSGTPATCDVPTGQASSSITSSSATVSWAAVSGALSYDVQYRVQGGSTWTSVNAIGGTSTNLSGLSTSTTYEWQVRTNCSGLSSAFSASATFATSAPAACNTPGGQASSSITSSAATVSWAAVSGALSYDVQYRVQGGSTWTSINAIGGTSTNLSGLSASTTYEWQVRANCSGSSSAFSASATFTTSAPPAVTYCASQGNSVVDEWIQRVQFGTINNNSGANAGYGNFTALSTAVSGGTAYTITITPGWAGSSFREAYNVWIDYNQDGDFVDAGEAVFTRARTNTTPVSGSFTIPTTAKNGSTRMRVIMKYNANATSCETFSYGEVEDYTLTISGGTNDLNPMGKEIISYENKLDILEIAPNPTPGEAKIKVFVPVKTDISIALTNIHGQGVSSEKIENAEGLIERKLNAQGLQNGVYFVNVVTSTGEKVTRKVIIQQ